MNDVKYFFSQTINMLYSLIAVNAILCIFDIRMPLLSYDINWLNLVGAIFSHANFSHLIFNMIGMYIFGTLLLKALKPWQFLLLYFFSGIIGNLIFIAFFQGQHYILLGASGAVFGIMTVAAMVEPDQRFMLIFLPFMPLKTKTLVIVYTIIELLSQASGSSNGTAHLAHLGGILGGYIFAEIFIRREIRWEPLAFLKKPKVKVQTFESPFKEKSKNDKSNNQSFGIPFLQPVSQKELDYLLDKVSQGGINSLTPEELARLRQAREQIIYQQKFKDNERNK
ncbi:MAG: rhomboid family intramembrane serine protease [Lentisphaeria bacterium]|nr:rhomboid family intramembrane serine protease [Lentisphaeria bacterium]